MNWYRIKSFIRFYFRAVTKYNVQSPFLFDFVTNVLDTQKSYYIFEEIENERKKLLNFNKTIKVNDFGAGSSLKNSVYKRISDIAKSSLSSKSKCKILFNTVLYFKSHHIIELGTSLGISSAYLASPSKKATIITLEGDESIAAIAKDVHESLGLKNIIIQKGKFSDTLKSTLGSFNRIDFAFLDGHHKEISTKEYFHMITEKCNNDSIVIIDDIYWSPEMNKAWNSIISKPEVTSSIDLYDIGIIFFKKELSKENISFIPYHFKPWRIGLFG